MRQKMIESVNVGMSSKSSGASLIIREQRLHHNVMLIASAFTPPQVTSWPAIEHLTDKPTPANHQNHCPFALEIFIFRPE
jgi:hypothetical protein